LNGALFSSCQGGVGRRVLLENGIKQDGIQSWYQLLNQYEMDSNWNVKIKTLDNVITTVFHRHYGAGLLNWIQEYEDTFQNLLYLDRRHGVMINSKKRWFLENTLKIGIDDTVCDELAREKSFIETCNFLWSHAIRHDQQNKEKATRQVNSTNQAISANKKDKVKHVLALINELQILGSNGSVEELEVLSSFKAVMICNLAQVPPKIWMTSVLTTPLHNECHLFLPEKYHKTTLDGGAGTCVSGALCHRLGL
jgi:hypothetical protein